MLSTHLCYDVRMKFQNYLPRLVSINTEWHKVIPQVHMVAHKMKLIVGFNSSSIETFIKMAVIKAFLVIKDLTGDE